ncbi:DUF4296 domain-containing protein [Spirosoma sp. BT702]|uniref:DUF4296 domain-containing protein n=1 Tax=Spirosoma profusum TaxID=2771354 RepID=A0A926XTP4_9BACT|nr:DUF4296 domain-containing protein [Spirosoma profusum]MBD2699654.1 DUF4296 domain-containing protein [Spirosoma profusum]
MRWNRCISDLRNLLILVFWLTGCTATEDERPENLIPDDRMVAILTEVHMNEARVSRLGLSSIDSSNIVYKRLETQLFKKMKVDTAVYRKSYIYYSSHPAEMEAIYKQVTKKLEQRITLGKPMPVQKTTVVKKLTKP